MHVDRLADAAGLAHDLEQRLELGAHAGAEQLVVVDDQDARRRPSSLQHQLDLGARARARS